MSSLDLSTLVFKVETKELDDAAKKLGVLATAVDGLNKVRKGAVAADKEATKAALDLVKVTEAQNKAEASKALGLAKVAEAQAKATAASAKATEASTKASLAAEKKLEAETKAEEKKAVVEEKRAKAEEKAAKASQAEEVRKEKAAQAELARQAKIQAAMDAAAVRQAKRATDEVNKVQEQGSALVEMQRLKNKYMTEGFSSGESTTLARAEMKGLGEEVELVLKSLLELRRELSGPNPFDNSLAGIDKLKIQHRELTEAMRQNTNQSGLSQKQSQELSRDIQRTTARLREQGKSQDEITETLKREEAAYIAKAKLVNSDQAALKEQVRLQRESANAVRAVATEEERMRSVVAQLTNAENQHMSVTEKAAMAQANYARNLKRAGIEGEEAARRLKVFENQQKVIDSVEQKRQAQYLQRGLQPQIGDVAVSLAAGQNPLTVLLQQGDQIRGLIAQTGVSGELLRETMRNAMTDTVKSIGQVSKAMGDVLLGAVTSLGGAVKDVTLGVFPLAIDAMKALATGSDVSAEKLKKMSDALALIGKVGIAAVIIALATLAYQTYKAIQAQDGLTRALALNGASMGLTSVDAADLALSMQSVGVTTKQATEVMQAMAKEGGFVKAEIAGVTKAAVDLNKYGGVAIEDTVKAYAKLKDDPVKGLIELGKATGEVNVKTLEQVESLTKVGDKTKAVSEAFKAMQQANSSSVSKMKEELSTLSLVMISIGEHFAKMIAGMFDLLFNKLSPETVMAQKAVELQEGIDKSEAVKKTDIYTIKTTKEKAMFDADLQRRKDALKLITEQYQAGVKAAKAKQSETEENIKLNAAFEKTINLRDQFLKTDKLMSAKVEAEKSYGLRIENEQEPTKRKALIKERDAVLAEIEKQRKNATKPEGETEEQKRLKNDIKIYDDLLNRSEGLSSSYNEEKAALDRRRKVLGDTPDMAEAYANLEKKQPYYVKQLAEEKAYTEGLNKANEERAKNMQKIAEYNNQTRDENLRLDYRLEVLGKTEEQVKALNRERDKELKLAKARDDYDKQILANKQVSSRPNAENAAALAAYEDRVKQINREIAVTAAEDLRKEYDAVMSPIADSISKALMVGGEEGANMIRKQIEDALLREPFQLIVNALVKDAMGVGGGNGVNLTNAMEKIGKTYSKFASLGSSQWFVNFGSKLGQTVGQAGTTLFNLGAEKAGEYLMSVGTGMGKYAASITKFAEAAGTALTWINGALLAGEGKWGAAAGSVAGTYIGTALGGPIGGAIGSWIGEKLGGFVDGLFGGGTTYMKNMGTTGQFSSTGFTGSNYTLNREEPNKWNSWFGESGKDVKSLSAMPDAVKGQLSAMYISTLNSASLMGQSMGLNMSWLKDFKQNIDIVTLDAAQAERYSKNKDVLASSSSTFEEKQKAEQEIADIDKTVKAKYDAVFETVRNKIAALTISPQFILQGEQAADAFARMSSALINVNNVMQNLGLSLYDITQNGADAASRLQDAFGGSEAFGQQMSSYYTGYYSADEQKANSLREMQARFAQLGINKTTGELANFTTADIRKIVEEAAKGRGTIAGDNTFAATVALANAFRPLIAATEDVTKNFKDLGKSIEDEIIRIRGEILGTGPEAQANAQMQFTLATAQARAGDAEAAGKLPALSQALLEYASNNASTLQELNQIRAATTASLTATAAIVKSFGLAPVTTVGSATSTATTITPNTITPNYSVTNGSSNTEVLVALEAVASQTNKTKDLLDRVINGEETLRVSVIPA